MQNLVSVIIPAYRAEGTIARAVRSLVQQHYPHWEAVIAVDDGVDYLERLAADGVHDPRLRQVSTGAIASGDGPARTTAMHAARGDYLAPLDADDAFAPDRLVQLAPLAAAHGAAVDNTGVIADCSGVYKRPFPDAARPFRLAAKDILRPRIPLFAVFRRELAGQGWPALPFCSDVVFNLELLCRAPAVVAHPACLYLYHKTAGSLTSDPQTAARAERGYRRILEQLSRGEFALSDEVRAAAKAEFEENLALNRVFTRFLREGRCRNLEEFLDMTDNGRAHWLATELA